MRGGIRFSIRQCPSPELFKCGSMNRFATLNVRIPRLWTNRPGRFSRGLLLFVISFTGQKPRLRSPRLNRRRQFKRNRNNWSGNSPIRSRLCRRWSSGIAIRLLTMHLAIASRASDITQQIMNFSTEANSGKMPGAALTAPAGAAAGGAAAAASLGANLAAGAGKTYTSAMSTMAQRSAKQAVSYMSQYFANQNWIPQSMVQTADTGSSGI
jgi:hypothetical protein